MAALSPATPAPMIAILKLISLSGIHDETSCFTDGSLLNSSVAKYLVAYVRASPNRARASHKVRTHLRRLFGSSTLLLPSIEDSNTSTKDVRTVMTVSKRLQADEYRSP